MALQFTDQTAREAIESGKITVIDFWATWCGPCIKLGPIVEELAEKYPDVTIGKLNIDENMEIAQQYRVVSIPTFMVFAGGKQAANWLGAMSAAELKSKVEQVIG